MNPRFITLFCLLVSSSLVMATPKYDVRSNPKDTFSVYIGELLKQMREHHLPVTVPKENELHDWTNILRMVRANQLDSCQQILHRYHYTLRKISDPMKDEKFIVIAENYPIQRAWGTFIYNRNYKKRLYIHVTRPVDEANTLLIGAEAFRRLGAEWLCVNGSVNFTSEGDSPAPLQNPRTVFAKWHEILTNLTHLTVSVRGFHFSKSDHPDIVVSNGRTFDQQWGISQISLALRDSLRRAGFDCMLAMYDSGYANLAGGSSREGIFSNDSTGFGHWLNIELSSSLRTNPVELGRFISVTNRALEITGKRISQEVNRAFGLVSPRVVRVDAKHRILFPPSDESSYRIVSFNPAQSRSDTINLQMGNWLDLVGERNSVVSADSDGVGKLFSRAKNPSVKKSPDVVLLAESVLADTSTSGGNESSSQEPIQTHRIPLKKVPVPEYIPEISSPQTPYTWNGILPANGVTPISYFQMTSADRSAENSSAVTEFLIPLLNRVFREGSEQCIGVQMNTVLVNEIARLVALHRMTDNQIGLVAEQDASGNYYLRIVPSPSSPKKMDDEIARRF